LSETKSNLIPIYLINFIGSLGFSIVVPFLIFLNADFGGNSFIFGILLAVYSIMQIPGATLLGRWSDKIGRKKVLIISQVGTLVCWGIYIVALLVPKITLGSFDVGGMDAFSITLPLRLFLK
jgi:DHA1 family tetracycline resistance protein-like MFS transporter